MKVYFIGAGPGDPELLTIKAYKILNSAECIIYPGSLINKELLKGLNGDLYDSANLSLEEIVEIMERYVKNGKLVARLVSGDPSIYSAIQEQIEVLRQKNIPYEIIPGVSSYQAASAKMGIELTIPAISQTIILTRFEGKTGGASKEEIKTLAKIKGTMVFFLSADFAENLQKTLEEVLPIDTPIAIAYKVCHKEEKFLFGSLKELHSLLKEHNIKKTALIFVGEALKAIKENLNKRSKLYGKELNV
jgi:precorrin-4/cobalt-precorrin-4 C11-methyltransferase